MNAEGPAGSSAMPGFVISGLLGEHGPLLAARQLGLDRAVVVKRLDGSAAGDPDAKARFQAEINLVGMLEHPGIIPVYEAGEDDDGRPFYVLRHIHGQPWSHRLGKQGREDDLDILERVAEALAYAHHQGVAHGSPDPERVILGEHGEILLTGWDSASHEPSVRAGDAAALAGILQRLWPEAGMDPVADAGAFLEALRRRRQHAAAQRLADRARTHLQAARADAGLDAWAKARFACAEALRGDPSPANADLARDIALGYAEAAAGRGDLGLALAVLDAQDPRQADLARDLSARIGRRVRRSRALRRLAWAALALLLLGAGILVVVMLGAEAGRRRAQAAEAQATAERQRASADAYSCTLAAIADHLVSHRSDLAQPLLDACAATARGWEWRRLRWLVARQLPTLDLGGSGRAWPLAVDGPWIAAPYGSTDIGLWRAPGKPERILRLPLRPDGLALDPDGGRLLTIKDQVVSCLDTADGHELWVADIGHPADRMLVLADHRILVFGRGGRDTQRLTVISADGHAGISEAMPGWAESFDRDGAGALMACGNDRVYEISLSPGIVFHELLQRGNAMLPAVRGGIRPRLALVAYGNGACGPTALDGGGFPWMGELFPVISADFSHDGSRFAGMGNDRMRVLLRRCSEPHPPQRIALPEPAHTVRFTGDDRTLVVTTSRQAILLPVEPGDPWIIDGGDLPRTACAAATAEGRGLRFADGRRSELRHASDITTVAAADGRIFSGDADGLLAVWDPQQARCLWSERLGAGPITAITPGHPLRLRSGDQTLSIPDSE